MKSILEQLQSDVAARLESLPDFQFVPILLMRPRDAGEALSIEDTINKSLAGLTQKNGKGGVSLLVSMPTMSVKDPETPGPQMIATVMIVVTEMPLINMGAAGTHQSAEQIGLNALGALHLFDCGPQGPLYADGEAMEPQADPGKIVYNCYLRTRIALNPARKTPRPVIASELAPSQEHHLVSITAIAGAQICYTTDGSFPAASNPEVHHYADPFISPIPAVIRSAAYADGRQGSDISTLNLK